MREADRAALALAYRLAAYAAGNSDPNPAVGAVLADKNGRIIATGFTHRAGFAHAERHALEKIAHDNLSDHTLYTTLEPCCHFGRTPPCTDIILQKKVGRVVIAERDFAAEVQGRSLDLLHRHGVRAEIWDENDFVREKWFTTAPFFFARRHLRPRLLAKWAQTRDGALAPQKGPSGKISGADTGILTAVLRFYCKLSMVAPGTVFTDSPQLTVRLPPNLPPFNTEGFSDFFRNFFYRQLHLIRRFLKNHSETKTIRAPQRYFLLPEKFSIPSEARHFLFSRNEWQQNFAHTLSSVLKIALAEGFNSTLVEGGPAFSQKLLEHGFADAVAIYRSHHKKSEQLWGSRGRSNDFSHLVSIKEVPEVAGYTLLEFARLQQDDFLLFVRKGDGGF
ncbi:MAG: bifunctional diaminohydroxyphosphoribosylaminopyrimidine deaminase/5-amino-6-(5-phosphoribosylamino)uracil reductase RibD [Turneriella sp.]|nr:bifunctional diaminohydroxyphosphoribosylaminopyrimidine deaminase/5-amino-6-(5-phosphoribosylamino)uracil reductase RibD [Leptospiraceae bacterium]MCX7633566.1 bifunctional diaminohydroxyphosphoribosylaminopyrimidine deaminase/5-amino-6-(5-phosphoribosylamino)uracil reductase RibD [Turneriella sp.]